MSIVSLAIIIVGYRIVFLPPWRESAAASTHTERRRND
jgi:hypothetical protein